MKAVVYGAGNIGRGFIGYLLAKSGYEVVFIDIDSELVEAINQRKSYPVRCVSEGENTEEIVSGVSAINGLEIQQVAKVIAEADLLATSVGANILKYIAPNIAAGLIERMDRSKGSIDLLLCENLMHADKVLFELIQKELSESEQQWVTEHVGFVEVAIGRMVPIQTNEMKDGDPLRICVEPYGFLPVDSDAFKNRMPAIVNMVPYAPFDFYSKRKLYIHNMGHAMTAYLGTYYKYRFIFEAIEDCAIKGIVQNAMEESGLALSAEYGASQKDLTFHIQDLLVRFGNKFLKDTCSRVGADPVRKLKPNDRLIGSMLMCQSQNITPIYVCAGIAAALHFYIQAHKLNQSEAQAREVLRNIAELQVDSKFIETILTIYLKLVEGISCQGLSHLLACLRKEEVGNVI